MNINTVILTGNLGSDAEIIKGEGWEFAKLSIAQNEMIKGEETVHWYNVALFGEKQVKFADEYLHKGDRVAVEGRLTKRIYDADGKEISVIAIKAFRVILLASTKSKPNNDEKQPAANPDDGLPF